MRCCPTDAYYFVPSLSSIDSLPMTLEMSRKRALFKFKCTDINRAPDDATRDGGGDILVLIDWGQVYTGA